MRSSFLNLRLVFYLNSILAAAILLAGCRKVELPFDDNTVDEDPNISIYTDYSVIISTYKVDSFATTDDSVFAIGHHIDPEFGIIDAGSYTELQVPVNEVQNQNVSFDSLVLMLNPNGNYYGDTLAPFKISVHRLLENIENEDADNTTFYNPRSFSFDPAPLGQAMVTIHPNGTPILRIKLSAALGEDLLKKLKANSDTIRSQETFRHYLNGLYLQADSTISKALFYFKSDSAGLVRLHYTLHGAIPQNKFIDLPFNSSKQFNSIRSRHTGTNLAAFPLNKTTVIASDLTGNKAYLNTNVGTSIKFSFPTLLRLKETHPYIKVLKAELVIKPDVASWKYPYQLPPYLFLYVIDGENKPTSLLTNASGQEAQTGNLVVDRLFGENTHYSYDITGFINTVIGEGQFSKSALMLVPPSGNSDASIDRLILDDQILNKNVQLKLYVLGL